MREETAMASRLFTIGYAGFPELEDFIRTLRQYGVQILIDVRSTPFSAYFACYNKDNLSSELQKNGILYFNYAKQFGARQEDRKYYRNGYLDFALFSASPQFLEGVQNVEKSVASIAFMCAEKHPGECHRAILVARAFSDRGHRVTHITPDGTLTQQDIEAELLNAYYPERDQVSLFSEDNRTEQELISAAYEKRNAEIGFNEEDLIT